MAERFTIKIVPPDGGTGELTVEDAMSQVLSAFRLLEVGSERAVWRLVSATTNSPFTVVAEAENETEAQRQKAVFETSLRQLRSGKFPDAWRRPDLAAYGYEFLDRSARSAVSTEFIFADEAPPVRVTPDVVVPALGDAGSQSERLMPPSTKRQVGSIEGVLLEVTTFFGKPALRVRERKSGREITCVLSDSLADRFADHATVHDVWARRRVTVRGVVLYNTVGLVVRVEALAVDTHAAPPRDLPSLRDPNFTGGLTAAEYLERFRAGELG